jgi:hypothetical protein
VVLAQDFGNLDAFDQAVKEKQKQDSITNTRTTVYDTTSYTTENSNEIVLTDAEILEQINNKDSEISFIEETFKKDRYGKDFVDLNCKDKIKYIEYLLKYNLKNKESCTRFVVDAIRLLQAKKDKLNILLNSQNGDSRALIFLHIKKCNDEYACLTNYLNRLIKD